MSTASLPVSREQWAMALVGSFPIVNAVAVTSDILSIAGKVIARFMQNVPARLVARIGVLSAGCTVFLGTTFFLSNAEAAHRARLSQDVTGGLIAGVEMTRGLSLLGLGVLGMTSTVATIQHVANVVLPKIAGVALGMVFYSTLLVVSLTKLVLQVQFRLKNSEDYQNLSPHVRKRALGEEMAEKLQKKENVTKDEILEANFRQIVTSVVKILIAILGIAAMASLPHIALPLGIVAGLLWILVDSDTVNEKLGDLLLFVQKKMPSMGGNFVRSST